jgi:hypothetical protein
MLFTVFTTPQATHIMVPMSFVRSRAKGGQLIVLNHDQDADAQGPDVSLG